MQQKFFVQLFLFFATIPLQLSCNGPNPAPKSTANNGKRNIKAYYFPIESLMEGKVYEYRSVDNELDPPFYWYYRSLREGNATYLTGMYYDPDFAPFQYVREEKVRNGMLLTEFFWFEKDSLGQPVKVPVSIKEGNVFPFEVSLPGNVLVSSICWKLPTDTLTKMTFVRNRQFDGDTTYTFRGKAYDCVKFHVRELIDNEREGHLEQEYLAREIYAKGIGLVYFKKDIAEDWKMEYELVHIYNKKTFEETFNVNLAK